MPIPGPVAYQPHAGSLAVDVMSLGRGHVSPSSVLPEIQTVLVPRAVFAWIAFSESAPRLCVINSQIVPVSKSTTGQGLPHVFSPSSQITFCSDQLLPSSVERLYRMSIFP